MLRPREVSRVRMRTRVVSAFHPVVLSLCQEDEDYGVVLFMLALVATGVGRSTL